MPWAGAWVTLYWSGSPSGSEAESWKFTWESGSADTLCGLAIEQWLTVKT